MWQRTTTDFTAPVVAVLAAILRAGDASGGAEQPNEYYVDQAAELLSRAQAYASGATADDDEEPA